MGILERAKLADSIFFYTEEVDSLATFYSETLGLNPKKAEQGHSYWFDTGSLTLVLHQREDQYMDGDYDHMHNSTLIWFLTDKRVKDIYKEVKAKDIATSGDVSYQMNRGLLVIRDPEGRRIGIMEIRT